MEQIDDFFEYFMRPWMASIYQETFDNLMNDINYFDVGKVPGFVSYLKGFAYVFVLPRAHTTMTRKRPRVELGDT